MDDLLNLKLKHDGVFALVLSPFDPNEVFETVCETFIPIVEAKKIKLTFSIDETLIFHSDNSASLHSQHHIRTDQPRSQLLIENKKSLPKLIGDQRRLTQVLLNIIKNATKFTLRGSIDVKANYDAQSSVLIVHVKDTGAGIAPEDIPKLFSRFGKLHRTAEMNHEGIGLGLTIVK